MRSTNRDNHNGEKVDDTTTTSRRKATPIVDMLVLNDNGEDASTISTLGSGSATILRQVNEKVNAAPVVVAVPVPVAVAAPVGTMDQPHPEQKHDDGRRQPSIVIGTEITTSTTTLGQQRQNDSMVTPKRSTPRSFLMAEKSLPTSPDQVLSSKSLQLSSSSPTIHNTTSITSPNSTSWRKSTRTGTSKSTKQHNTTKVDDYRMGTTTTTPGMRSSPPTSSKLKKKNKKKLMDAGDAHNDNSESDDNGDEDDGEYDNNNNNNNSYKSPKKSPTGGGCTTTVNKKDRSTTTTTSTKKQHHHHQRLQSNSVPSPRSSNGSKSSGRKKQAIKVRVAITDLPSTNDGDQQITQQEQPRGKHQLEDQSSDNVHPVNRNRKHHNNNNNNGVNPNNVESTVSVDDSGPNNNNNVGDVNGDGHGSSARGTTRRRDHHHNKVRVGIVGDTNGNVDGINTNGDTTTTGAGVKAAVDQPRRRSLSPTIKIPDAFKRETSVVPMPGTDPPAIRHRQQRGKAASPKLKGNNNTDRNSTGAENKGGMTTEDVLAGDDGVHQTTTVQQQQQQSPHKPRRRSLSPIWTNVFSEPRKAGTTTAISTTATDAFTSTVASSTTDEGVTTAATTSISSTSMKSPKGSRSKNTTPVVVSVATAPPNKAGSGTTTASRTTTSRTATTASDTVADCDVPNWKKAGVVAHPTLKDAAETPIDDTHEEGTTGGGVGTKKGIRNVRKSAGTSVAYDDDDDDDNDANNSSRSGVRSVSSRIQMFEVKGRIPDAPSTPTKGSIRNGLNRAVTPVKNAPHHGGNNNNDDGSNNNSARRRIRMLEQQQIAPSTPTKGSIRNRLVYPSSPVESNDDKISSQRRLRTGQRDAVPLVSSSSGHTTFSSISSPVQKEVEYRRAEPIRKGKRSTGGLYSSIQGNNNDGTAATTNPAAPVTNLIDDSINTDDDDIRSTESRIFIPPLNDGKCANASDVAGGKVQSSHSFRMRGDDQQRSHISNSIEPLTDDEEFGSDMVVSCDDDVDTVDHRRIGGSVAAFLSSDDGTGRSENEGDFGQVQKQLARAHDREKRWQSRYEKERAQWQASQIELKRVRKERDRLLCDQAEQRKVLSDSQRDARGHEDELAKIRKALEWTNTCMASGSTTEGAKTALDLQSRIESLVQDNRQLQAEKEHLLQQQVVTREQHKRRNYFSPDSETETSLPKTLLKFLQSISHMQHEVVRQIDLTTPGRADGNGNNDLAPPSPEKTSEWEECVNSLSDILQSSPQAVEIEKVLEEVHRRYQDQLQAVLMQQAAYNKRWLALARNHADERAGLEARQEEWKTTKDKTAMIAAQQIQELKHELEKERILFADLQTEYDQVTAELDQLTAGRNAEVQSIQAQSEGWNLTTKVKDGPDATTLPEGLHNSLRDRDAEIITQHNTNALLESQRVVHVENLARANQMVEEQRENETRPMSLENSPKLLQSPKEKAAEGEGSKNTSGMDDMLKRERDAMEAENGKLEEKYSELQIQHTKTVVESRKNISDLKAMMEESSSGYEETISQCQAQNEHLNEKLTHLSAENALLLSKCGELEATVAAHLEIMDEHTTTREALHSLKKDSAIEVEQIMMVVDKLRSEVSEMNSKNDSLHGELEQKITERTSLAEELDSTRMERDDSLDKIEQLQVQVNELQLQATNAGAERSALVEEHTTSLACMVTKHEAELEALRHELACLDGLAEELRISRDLTRQMIDETNESLSTSNKSVENNEDQGANSTIDLEAKVAAAIETIRGGAVEMKLAKVEKEERMEEIFKLKKELKEIAAKFEKELAAVGVENTMIKDENHRQKQEIEFLENDLKKNSRELKSMSSVDNLDASLNDFEWSEVSEFVDKLKEQNESFFSKKMQLGEYKDTLMERNTAQQALIELLETKLQDLKSSTHRRDVIVRNASRSQKISIDSLYVDLTQSRECISKLSAMLSELEGVDPKHDRRTQLVNQLNLIDSAKNTQSRRNIRKALVETTKGQVSTADVARTEQSDILKTLMEKKSSKQGASSWNFFGKSKKRAEVPISDGTLELLKEENLSLKSSLVKLQSQHKEAMYKYKQRVEELELANEAIVIRNMVLEKMTEDRPK